MTNIIALWPGWSLYLLAGIVGAITGSFANVCIVRLPRDKSIIRPQSHCILCGHELSWWENIPILSFAILKGRCRSCGGKISIRYPAVEIVCTLLALASWWHFREPLRFFIYYCLLVLPLVIITFIDLQHKIIPDVISIPGIFAGLGVRTLFAPPGRHAWALLDSFSGAIVGGLFLFFVAFAYEKLKKQEGLGGGDIKLIAMLGAFFGWRAAIFMLFVSSILGSIAGIILILIYRKDRKYAIPFGPFLALAGLFQMFFGDRIIQWYLGLFHFM